MMLPSLECFTLFVITFISNIDMGLPIGCFTCSSFNGSDVGCRDPFNPARSSYQRFCNQGMKNRVGTFPASFCIKMNGVSLSTGAEIIVRTCTIITMGYQCGIFNFENEYFKGCLATCFEDGCNGAVTGVRQGGHLSARFSYIIPALVIIGYHMRELT